MLDHLVVSQALVEAERYRAEATRESVALTALETYWIQARARGEVAVAQASLQEIEEQAGRVERMLAAGLVTQADRDAAEARRAAALERRVRAEGAEETWRVSTNALLRLPLSTRLAIPGAELEPPRAEIRGLADLVEQGRSRRPEARALRSVLRAFGAQRNALLGQRLPHLGLGAEAIYAQPNPNVIPPQEAFDGSWSVSARLSWSPNDLFRAHGVDEQIQRDEQRTKAELAELMRNIEVDVYRQAAALRTARGTWSAAGARLKSARATLAARSSAFASGVATYTEVLEAEADLSDARLSRLAALIDTHLAEARLARAVGRLAIEP